MRQRSSGGTRMNVTRAPPMGIAQCTGCRARFGGHAGAGQRQGPTKRTCPKKTAGCIPSACTMRKSRAMDGLPRPC